MIFSVITIVYNDVHYIENTIKSVIEQKNVTINYIIVDGASTDGTSEKINNFRGEISTYIREKDTGIYNAMNKGLREVKGDYVIFMNSGDTFSSNNVLEEIEKSIGSSKPALVYGNYQESKNGTPLGVIPCRSSSKIWWGPIASHQSTFYRVDFLNRNGLLYDESYKIGADYRLTLEVIKRSSGNVLKTNICISNFDTSGASNNNQNQGLKDANRARHEILGWSPIKCYALSLLLLMARYTKRFAGPLYNILRR